MVIASRQLPLGLGGGEGAVRAERGAPASARGGVLGAPAGLPQASRPLSGTVRAWLEAAGKRGNTSVVVMQRIITAARFMKEVMGWSDSKVRDGLRGVDVSSPLRVAPLPTGTIFVGYVRRRPRIEPIGYEHQPVGDWFTVKGVRPEQVGIARGDRRLGHFRPTRKVRALQTRAAPIIDTWTPGRSYMHRHALGEMVEGGAAQYLVADKAAMKEVCACGADLNSPCLRPNCAYTRPTD